MPKALSFTTPSVTVPVGYTALKGIIDQMPHHRSVESTVTWDAQGTTARLTSGPGSAEVIFRVTSLSSDQNKSALTVEAVFPADLAAKFADGSTLPMQVATHTLRIVEMTAATLARGRFGPPGRDEVA